MELTLGQPTVDNDTNILDIDIPAEMENAVNTGHPYVNLLFSGDGIIPGTCALITGLPGVGKTTLMLQLADKITEQGHICVYNTGEESLFQVRRVANRLGLNYGFIPAYHRHVDDIITQLRSLQEDNPEKQIFFIQDSLQCLEPSQVDLSTGLPKKGRPKTGLNAQVEAVNELTSFMKETFGIFLLIGQVTKQGSFAGRNEVKHILDCHLHLGIDTDKRNDSYGQRIAEMQKNRFGPAGLVFGFEVNNSGLIFES